MIKDDKIPGSDDSQPGLLPGNEMDGKTSIHPSLLSSRRVLIVDEEGDRRLETAEIVKKILPNAKISVAGSPEEAEVQINKKGYDTYVVNLLMPGYSNSEFVKAVHNHPKHPLMVGFSADKMSDAYDPKKGIKIKPLRKLFEINTNQGRKNEENSTQEDNKTG
ncbi:hypothetical protein ACFL5V_02860 [Fibrobacterota bacterium]